jgi:pantetheine-phosphate adenylyltransferase
MADDRIAVYAGSFDPITNGHLDIIQRAEKLYDIIYVAVGRHRSKAGWLSVEARIEAINAGLDATVYADVDGGPPEQDNHRWVKATSYEGLTVNFCKKVGACAMIRGLRTVTDFDQEFAMGVANMGIAPDIETVFMLPKPENHFVSSSMVREIWSHAGHVSEYVPPKVEGILVREKGTGR